MDNEANEHLNNIQDDHDDDYNNDTCEIQDVDAETTCIPSSFSSSTSSSSPSNVESFLLIDENEILQINSPEEFAQKLGCMPKANVKVVSIFGTIGHGKSYTLNNAFFNCKQVFKTSSSQDSCTIGIWAAYDSKKSVITFDTEGLLGISANCQRRTRLLLKVLAISDIIIYRTKSERLEDNLFTFLGDASRVYVEHFFKEMKNAFHRLPELKSSNSLSENGPVVIIFQETRDTEPLQQTCNQQSNESIIRDRFKTLGLSTEAFSAIEYVGIKTSARPTNFGTLRSCINRHIKSSSSRMTRPVSVVYGTLKVLNEKFNGDIEKTVPSMFNNTLLTCPVKCLSCNARCINSTNHHRDGIGHHTNSNCVYQHQFDNNLLYCRACYERGEEVIVTPRTCSTSESQWLGLAKCAWSGYVLECPRCGVIHRTRQYWYGNKETCDSSVRTEIKHVWPGELSKQMRGAQNTAQRVLDSVSYLTETMSSLSAKPTKLVSEWVADQIAPSYWIPNSRILHCALCTNEFGQFDQKHHCRLCGNGLCSTCSSKSKPVPERGWGETSVRVCDRCYERSDSLSAISSLPPLPVSLFLPQQGRQQFNNEINDQQQQTKQQVEKEPPILVKQDLPPHIIASMTPEPPTKPVVSLPSPAANPPTLKTGAPNHKNPKQNGINGTGNANGNGKNNKKNQAFNNNNNLSNKANKNNNNNNNVKSSAASKSIPIPKNRSSNSGGCSSNTTPTQESSSSADSTSSANENLMATRSLSTSDEQQSGSTSPLRTNGITSLSGDSISLTLNNFMAMNGDSAPTNTARKLGEVLQSTFKTVVTAIDYPLGVIKDSARPEYWVPDSEIVYCGICRKNFDDIITIHHCRRCGGGYCHDCSSKNMLVPEKGWGDAKVRVCDKCYTTSN